MRRISKRAANYLRDELLRRERFIVLLLNSQRKILSVNRSTPDWHLPGLTRGSMLPESLCSLLDTAAGVLPPVVFNYVEVSGYYIDIHVLGDENLSELVFHDVSETHRKEQTLQQRAHEISLLSDRRAALNEQLAQLNRELDIQRQQAEKASAAKSRFIASMSHEFRSPIASIMGYADRLRTELPDSTNPQALQRAAWHLLTLVENLLEQARYGEENVPLNPTRFSLNLLMEDITALFDTQADAKQLTFEVETSPGDIDIELDELRLRQILINLVSNALRYTTRGRVSVRVQHRDDILHIHVIDTGQGIAAKDMQRIFEPFTRVGHGNISGAGLGLTITRQLVRRMHGEIEVDSKIGVGSEFRVSIPCPQVTTTDREKTTLSGTVLWVDDDQDILFLYQGLLEDWGLRVHTASSAAQAKSLMKRHACPVVVTDMHLTDGDGLELMSHIWEEQPAVAGILISGSGITDLSPEIPNSGIRAFLQKPIDLEALRSEITAALEGGSANHVV